MDFYKDNSHSNNDHIYPILPKKDLPFRPWNAKALELNVEVADPTRNTDDRSIFVNDKYHCERFPVNPENSKISERYCTRSIEVDTVVEKEKENTKFSKRGNGFQKNFMDKGKQQIINEGRPRDIGCDYAKDDCENSRSGSSESRTKIYTNSWEIPANTMIAEVDEKMMEPIHDNTSAFYQQTKHIDRYHHKFSDATGKKNQKISSNNSLSNEELKTSSVKNQVVFEGSSDGTVTSKTWKEVNNKNLEWNQPCIPQYLENLKTELTLDEGKNDCADDIFLTGNVRPGCDDVNRISRNECDHNKASQEFRKAKTYLAGERSTISTWCQSDVFQVADNVRPAWGDGNKSRTADQDRSQFLRKFDVTRDDRVNETVCNVKSGWGDKDETKRSEWNQPKVSRVLDEIENDWAIKKNIISKQVEAVDGWCNKEKHLILDSREFKDNESSNLVNYEKIEKKNWSSTMRDVRGLSSDKKQGLMRELNVAHKKADIEKCDEEEIEVGCDNLSIKNNHHNGTEEIHKTTNWNKLTGKSPEGLKTHLKTDWNDARRQSPNEYEKNFASSKQWSNVARRTPKKEIGELMENDSQNDQFEKDAIIDVRERIDKMIINPDVTDNKTQCLNPAEQSSYASRNEVPEIKVNQLVFDGLKFVPEPNTLDVEPLINLGSPRPSPAHVLPSSSKLEEELKQINFFEYLKQEMEKEANEAKKKSQAPGTSFRKSSFLKEFDPLS
ncbi:12687_t:CDS:2 [Acaulospora morrowiae]|uniref:12687_t:CDS:1 n=1 Tax=Acaulospora morrowiae TaxID=94023 RepID=A0A9N9FIU7_9GLOM|nr:12687_t:CDS:2 [Acaulospora morrowiae]